MLKRPLCVAAIVYIIGIIIGLYFKTSIALLLIILCITICVPLYLLIDNKKIIIWLIILCIGAIQIKIIDYNYNNQYKELKENEEYYIKGIVVDDGVEKQYKYVYKIKIENINNDNKLKNTKWILDIKNVKMNKNKLKYGDLIEIKGNIKIPSEARNYGGFNYRKYLKTQNIYGTIETKECIDILEREKNNLYSTLLYKISNHIKNQMHKLLSKNAGDICIGILIGEKKDIQEKIVQNFKNSNLTHMLAVSGAHISYIMVGISLILKRSDKRFQKIFIIGFLILFMAITKFTPSVQRASIMTIIILISNLVHRKSDIYNNLALSAIIILLLNPYSILDIGFQLSFRRDYRNSTFK